VKLLLAIIQPNKLNPVREALYDIGVTNISVLDAQGYGRQKGHSAMYGGVEYKINMLRKVMLEIEVHEDYMERTLETIQTVAKTGSEGAIGDGKVFILPTLDLGMNQ
jgi:nitrogen regulatory protein P-II 2